MKKIILLTAFLVTIPLLGLPNYTSQSFMYPRPASHNLAAEQAIWHYYMRSKTGPIQGCVQVIPFYQSTTPVYCDTDDKAASYFLIDCKTQLTVMGDGNNAYRDVRAEWLGINNPLFMGKLSLSPKQRQYGAVLEYYQGFAAFTDRKVLDAFWFGIMLPFVTEKNNPGLHQSEVVNPAPYPGPRDIIEAFDQPAWRYSRINGDRRKSGLGECKLKFGATFATRRDAEVIFYSLLSIPTSSRQCATYFFSPFLGNNAHWTYGSGVAFQVPFSGEFDAKQVFFFIELEHLYMFGNTQERTFDLKNKQWSRFLLLNSRDGTQTNVPGVNILTRRVHARPDSFVDFVTGFRARWNDRFEAEIAYNLWAHGTERIELKRTYCGSCNDEIPLSNYGIAGDAPGTSASSSTIAMQAANDPVFIPLNDTDLDLHSGAAAAAYTNKIHGALGYGFSGEKFASFFALGGSWEAVQNNAAFSIWTIWGKIGASF